MNIDLTKNQAILLVAMLDEKIPVSRPEIESEFLKAKQGILACLVGEICHENKPQ